MGLGLGLTLWGSMVGHPSNSWASCAFLVLAYPGTPGQRAIKWI